MAHQLEIKPAEGNGHHSTCHLHPLKAQPLQGLFQHGAVVQKTADPVIDQPVLQHAEHPPAIHGPHRKPVAGQLLPLLID